MLQALQDSQLEVRFVDLMDGSAQEAGDHLEGHFHLDTALVSIVLDLESVADVRQDQLMMLCSAGCQPGEPVVEAPAA